MAVINTTTDNFKKDVLENQKVVLVDFWAEWCGPCRMVAPVLDEIAKETPALEIVKVNVDEQPQLAMDYNVTGIPLLGVFKGGKMVKQLVGARPKAAIMSELKEFLA
ncbi:MAG: thioredoxin [Actinomycetota bacterium]|jgi:thioredoxin 1